MVRFYNLAMATTAIQIESFQPEKRTLGQILSSTSPPIRVPDYQRDFSWKQEQISDFWSDLNAFGGNDPQIKLSGKEYFLGAAVLVNNGIFHLLLDGQQRIGTSTILLAALRDKIQEYKADAAQQIQDQYIAYVDHLTGERIFKIEMNLFDRSFFRNYIQSFPRVPGTAPQKNSHQLIAKAYAYFQEHISQGWEAAGGGKKGFEWAAHVTQTLREHMVLVTVTSNNERSASAIFATLNDRGIGLSTVDLIRTWVLQAAHDTARQEILECWDSAFNACGTTASAETLIRMAWVAQHGDVKARALYKVVSDEIPERLSPLDYSRGIRRDALFYRQFRDGDTDDGELQEYWLAFRTLGFNAGLPTLISANRNFPQEDQKRLARALVALVVRHNIVCNLDRARTESAAYAAAKRISEGAGILPVIDDLRVISPSDELFTQSFASLKFTKAEHGVARYVLRTLEAHESATAEVDVAGPDRVHIEHIYPQTPKDGQQWEEHDSLVTMLGNLTLLGRRLNEQIKNSDFATKKQQAYQATRLALTEALLRYDSWSPTTVRQRQIELGAVAQKLWPFELVPD
jgi:Protein of unknown function DUF262/Protein of unknown function (DUF1524)